MKTYIYPENLRANVKLWFWSVRDFIIICGGIILSVVILVNFWNVLPFAATWFCQYHLTHFIRTRIMQRERYDHSRAFFGLPEAAHRWRCRFFC